jgi:hypothetical protein
VCQVGLGRHQLAVEYFSQDRLRQPLGPRGGRGNPLLNGVDQPELDFNAEDDFVPLT